jgi:CheY-like chemotaxis protein
MVGWLVDAAMPRKKPGKSAAKAVRRQPPRPRSPRGAADSSAVEAALAVFAHDIRTSLTGILALGELLASSNLGERERRWALGIKSSAEHLAALTTLAIDGARAEAAGLVLRDEVFRPRRLVEALAESLAARAETKGLAVEVAVAGELPETVSGDAVRLRAALENLIDNAVKFTEQGTVRLEIATAPAPASRRRMQLIVTVIDSGIGLTAAEIKRLYRPFAQANDDIARRYGGAGLGLAFVKRLAKRMGGDLTVTSRMGAGSSFRLAVPLAVTPGGTEGESTAPGASGPERRLSVLCAEDNPYGRVVLNTILTELGHHADFVASGEEAVEAVARGYDVVLMDVTLTGIDGLEATRRIRALAGALGRMPIIGISGRSEAGDEAAARAAGMNDYVRKPVSPRALSDAIATVTRMPAATN